MTDDARPPLRPESRAIRAGRTSNAGSLATPIWPSTTWELPDADTAAEMATSPRSTEFYGRNGTPTVQSFADAVAELEGAEAGLAMGSGMGAITTTVLGFCSAGDRIVAQTSMFSVTAQLLGRFCPRMGIEVDFVDAFDADTLRAAVAAKPTQLVYCETPANPVLGIVDLEALGSLAGPFTVVDSTMASPYVQNPHDHGVHLVVHAATKSLAGHNDAMLGVVTGDAELVDVVWRQHVVCGAVASPFDAFLGLRGIRSFHARQRQQNETALVLAEALEALPSVERVLYPGLPSHPQHDLAMSQMRAGGSIVVIEAAGGYEAGNNVLSRIELARPALSLGGPETLVTHPASMSAATMSPPERAAMGIGEGMLRISVGLEHVDDLIADLTAALA